MYEEKDSARKESENLIKQQNLNVTNTSSNINGHVSDQQKAAWESDKLWKQEEQKSLEIALQKFPKDTPARWDKISDFVSTKTKVCDLCLSSSFVDLCLSSCFVDLCLISCFVDLCLSFCWITYEYINFKLKLG